MSDEYKTNEYQIDQISCPVCENDKASVITHLLDIPYYDDYVMLNISCSNCGYRTSDFRNMKVKDHTIMRYRIEGEEDGTTKVVRSSDGIVRIDEIGVEIRPTGDSTTWIRNIEGILLDIRDKLSISLRYSETTQEKEQVNDRLKEVDGLLNFEKPFTIEVEDPSGNSVILPAIEGKLETIIVEPEE